MTTPSSVFFKPHWAFGDKSKLDDKAITGDPPLARVRRGANMVLTAGLRYSQNKVNSDYGRYLTDLSGQGRTAGQRPGHHSITGVFVDFDPAGLLLVTVRSA